MDRSQMTFYASFWDAINSLPKRDQLPVFRAVISYGLSGDHKEALTPTQNAFFTLMQPVLDSSRKKAANGKQNGSKTETKRKQTEKEKEKEKRGKGKEEKEKEKDKPAKPPKPKNTAKQMAKLEKDIAKLEEKIAELDKLSEEHATDYQKLMEIGEEKESLELELMELYERWEALDQ